MSFESLSDKEQLEHWEKTYKEELDKGRSPESFGMMLLAMEINAWKDHVKNANCRRNH